MTEIGTIQAIYRYPVKSMAGERLTSAELGWHGIAGDRRYAIMRPGVTSGFPWLNAGKMPGLVRYQAYHAGAAEGGKPVVRVRIPSGGDVEVTSAALAEHIAGVFGNRVEVMKLSTGIFDDSPLSLISTATIRGLEAESGRELDVRRFRPNIVIEPSNGGALPEESWVMKTLTIGDAPDGPAVRVTLHDIRCVMVNLDPETAESDPEVLKTVVRTRNKCAGVYGSTFRSGTIRVGDKVRSDG